MSRPSLPPGTTRPLEEGATGAPALHLSASQFETWERCQRAWWFERVRRLPTLSRGSTTFGTIVHAVLERHLRADELGRGPDGQPVELYPEGWHTIEERGERSSITEEEQLLVRRLVSVAVQEGVIQRWPGRVIEDSFDVLMDAPNTTTQRGPATEIRLVGKIDVRLPDAIIDHKTAKSRTYLLSPSKLAESRQMTLYGQVAINGLRTAGAPIPPVFGLRHNGFVKDFNDPLVRATTAEVTPVHLAKKWTEAREMAREMSRLYHATLTGNVAWHDVAEPDPSGRDKACRAYGGCPFLSICFDRKTEGSYIRQVEAKKASTQAPSTSGAAPLDRGLVFRTAGGLGLSIFAHLTPPAKPAAAPAVTAPAAVPPSQNTAAAVLPVTAPAPAASAPRAPWYNPECPTCRGNPVLGIASKGNQPCRICIVKNNAHPNAVNGAWYDVEPLGTVVRYTAKEEFFDAIAGALGDAPGALTGEFPWTGATPAPAAAKVVEAPLPAAEPFAPPAHTAVPAAAAAPTAPAASAPPPVAAPAAPAQATPETPRKRGRPPGSKNKATADAAPAEPVAADATTTETEDARPLEGRGRVLLVGASINAPHSDGVKIADGIFAALAGSQGASSYYDLDSFKRRDCIARVAAKLWEEIELPVVFPAQVSQDVRAVIDALRIGADVIITGQH